jgi:protein-disulfide isomerase
LERSATLVIPFGTPFVIRDEGLRMGWGQPEGELLFPFFELAEKEAVIKALSGATPVRMKRKMAAAFVAGVFSIVVVASIAGSGDAPATSNAQPATASGPTIGPEALLENSIQFGAKDAVPEKTLYVFTDPQCPYCKEFDRTLASLGAEWSVRVLPVGFKPGSMQMADAALCAKDPAQAWKYTIQGRSVNESQSCYRSAKKNTETFALLGMTSTPSTLRGDGKLFEGAVSKAELESSAQ